MTDDGTQLFVASMAADEIWFIQSVRSDDKKRHRLRFSLDYYQRQAAEFASYGNHRAAYKYNAVAHRILEQFT